VSNLLKNPKICGHRNKPGCKLKCTGELVFYCGKKRQHCDWPRHMRQCTVALAAIEVQRARMKGSERWRA